MAWPRLGAMKRGAVQRTVGIADCHLCHIIGEGVLDGGQPEHQMADHVAHRLCNGVAQCADCRESASGPQYLIANITALRAVAVQQFFIARPVNNQCELPGKIESVLHAGVHTLASGRTVDMCGVSRQEGPAPTIL